MKELIILLIGLMVVPVIIFAVVASPVLIAMYVASKHIKVNNGNYNNSNVNRGYNGSRGESAEEKWKREAMEYDPYYECTKHPIPRNAYESQIYSSYYLDIK